MNDSVRRKHIWEIADEYFCSVCGTCLDLNEQKLILKKIQINDKDLTDHDIHTMMVQCLHSENKLSRRLDRHLNAKYHYEISEYGDHDDSQFLKVWSEYLKTGEICGLYFVALTHTGLSNKTLHKVFADVHMLSHLNGGKMRKEKAEYARLLRVNTELTAKLGQEKKKRKELADAVLIAEKTRRELEARVRNLEKNVPAVQSVPLAPQDLMKANRTIDNLLRENRDLGNMLNQTKHDLRDTVEQMDELKKGKKDMECALRSQKEINIQLLSEIDHFLSDPCCERTDCGTYCHDEECCRHLCEKRVLIVGGITKLRSHYQNVVENLGGNFEYHDGYLKSGEKELESLIKKSDIILCPVDCNSHGACISVKKICKRIKKPYHMLASSSLSSISDALTAAGKAGASQ